MSPCLRREGRAVKHYRARPSDLYWLSIPDCYLIATFSCTEREASLEADTGRKAQGVKQGNHLIIPDFIGENAVSCAF